MKWFGKNDFSGGLNNYLPPAALGGDYAAVLTNADVAGKNLQPINGPGTTAYTSPTELGHYGSATRSVVQWLDKYYWTDNVAGTYGGSPAAPGITPPAQTLMPLVMLSGTRFQGIVRYCMTFETTDGWESAPGTTYPYFGQLDTRRPNSPNNYDWQTATVYKIGDKVTDNTEGWVCVTGHTSSAATQPASGSSGPGYWTADPVVNVGADTIQVYGLPTWTASNIAKRHLYRTQVDGAAFYWVATIDDNTTTVYADSLADDDLLLRDPLETLNWLPPPAGGKYLNEKGGIFFVAVGDRVYYSQQSNPHAWSPLDWIGFDATITGTSKDTEAALIFTANRLYRVTGTSRSDISKKEKPGQQGCPNWRTLATVSNTPLWTSNDGICGWNGDTIELLTKTRYSIEFTPTHAVSANDVYYLFHAAGCAVLDFRHGNAIYETDIISDYAWYDADRDKLYLQTDSTIAEWGTGAVKTWTYKTGWLPGEPTRLKHFRRLAVDATAAVSVAVYLDGTLKGAVTTPAGGRHILFLPAGLTGSYIELLFTGTGTLTEWKVEYANL